MPTVIDSLVLEFSLDPTKFTQGQRAVMQALSQMQQQAAGQGNNVEAAGKRMQNFLTGVKREAIGLLAVFFGARGIKEFTSYMTQLDAALLRSSKTLDMSAKDLSAWQGVARQMGGSAAGVTGSMQGLTDKINQALATGNWGNLLQIFNQFGVDLYNTNGQLKTAGELFLELNRAFQGVDPARARSILSMLGLDSDSINIILMKRDALIQMLDAQKKSAAGMDEDAAAAAELQKHFEGATTAAERFGASLLASVTPALNKVLDGVRSFFEWMRHPEGTPMPGGETPDFVPDFSGTGTGSIYSPSGGGGGGSSNMTNFLSGLSFLETRQRNTPRSARHSAAGFFQFQPDTASDAVGAGIADPRAGSYDSQAAATEAFIRKFYPAAAAAIDAGRFDKAAAMLKGRWPSLPGGSQPQNKEAYATYAEELKGGGPRVGAGLVASRSGPTSTSTSSKHVNINEVNINAQGQVVDANSVARNLGLAIQAETGLQ